MKTIDINNTKLTPSKIALLAQAEPITLVKDNAGIAIVMSMDQYKTVEKLKTELALSKSENKVFVDYET